MVANCGEDLFFGLHLISGKMTSISGEDLFLVFGLHSISATKYIISTKLFVKLVKAAKASPHAKFYNLSTDYGPEVKRVKKRAIGSICLFSRQEYKNWNFSQNLQPYKITFNEQKFSLFCALSLSATALSLR